MFGRYTRVALFALTSLLTALGFSSCGNTQKDHRNKVVVSVRDQKMLLLRDGRTVKSYRVSTSKFGIGDKPGSNCTPLGRMEIASKIGEGYPSGTVFKSRRPTGEILRPNAPGRDPIVSRILWLKGTEQYNTNAFKRCIYIHGTPEEWRLGSPASYGCIRMGSKDVIDLYKNVGQGAEVFIVRGSVGNSVQTNSVAVATNTPDSTTFYGNN
jgi:lipoprotein-anchoring transpeptidase ErfK/SrfK